MCNSTYGTELCWVAFDRAHEEAKRGRSGTFQAYWNDGDSDATFHIFVIAAADGIHMFCSTCLHPGACTAPSSCLRLLRCNLPSLTSAGPTKKFRDRLRLFDNSRVFPHEGTVRSHHTEGSQAAFKKVQDAANVVAIDDDLRKAADATKHLVPTKRPAAAAGSAQPQSRKRQHLKLEQLDEGRSEACLAASQPGPRMPR
jgi:hypothetical protein